MDRAARIEAVMDLAAAALLCAAVAYLLLHLGVAPLLAAGCAGAAFFACWRLLTSVAPLVADPSLAFEAAPFPPLPEPLPELLLTAADQLPQESSAEDADELVLDARLIALGTNARVVRLFDPAAMTASVPAQDQIEVTLVEKTPPTAPPDASQALYEALADLRRSLR